MAQAVTDTRLGEHVGSVGHRLHATGQDDLATAGTNQVMGQHGGFHARAAQLVDGGGATGVGNAGLAHRLAGRALLDATRQHAAHDALVDSTGFDTAPLNGGANGSGGKFGSRETGEPAQHAAHGGAGSGQEYNIGGAAHDDALLYVSIVIFVAGKRWSTPFQRMGSRPMVR